MTREEAKRILDGLKPNTAIAYGNEAAYSIGQALTMAIKALEQEPRKDEVILTKEEYGELVSSEFDNGYAKGYREALEQEPILDKIRAEIEQTPTVIWEENKKAYIFASYFKKQVLQIIDKYRKEQE